MHKLNLTKWNFSLLAIALLCVLLVACNAVEYTNKLANDPKDYRGDMEPTWHALAPDQKQQIAESSYEPEFSYGYPDKIGT